MLVTGLRPQLHISRSASVLHPGVARRIYCPASTPCVYPGLRFTRCHAQKKDLEESELPPPPDVIVEINVDEGDTLNGLAQMYHLPFEKLLAANKGNANIKPGDKLRFSIPMPKDQEALRQLLMPTKELIRDALLERAAETGSDTVGGQASEEEQKQERQFQGVPSREGDHTFVTTAKYLGGTAAKLLLLSAAIYLLVRLGRRLTEGDKAKASKSGADWPTISDADLETRFRLKRPEERPTNGHLKGNRGGAASTSTATAPQTAARPEAVVGASNSATRGSGDSAASSVAAEKGGSGYSAEDPAWLALPAVHYALLPGNQQPCFRVALGHTDSRAWLAWEDAEDLRRLLRCMEANGLLPQPAAVGIVACPPYEYLQTAEHNGRPVGFVPKGTLIEEAWHDEQLMDALVAAAQVVPRQPSGVPCSAQAILNRWRQRTGLTVDSDNVLGSGAWEVRSIDEDHEEGYTGLIEEGRVIEAHTEPLQGADSAEQQPLPQEEGSAGTSPEAAGGRDKVAADDRSVWQRLRGIRRGAHGAKAGEGGVSQNGRWADSGGRLSAGRILERSTSKNGGTGGADPFAEMLGLGSGSQKQSKQQRTESLPQEHAGPEVEGQQHLQSPAFGSEQSGAAHGGTAHASGASDVSGTAGSSTGAEARTRRYAELLSKQRDVASAHTHLDKVRREPLPVEHNDQEDDTSSESSHQSSAASPSSAADWARAARRGQRLTDLTAKGASQSPQASQAQARSTRRGNTGAVSTEWLQLPMVCVPVREFTDGSFGFLTANTAAAAVAEDTGLGADTGAAPRPAIVGFADRGDAQQVQWLWDSWPQAEVGSNRVMPLPPAKLQSVAQEQGFSVVVFPKGQLPLRPGMSEEELGALFSAYAVQ
ncbi:g3355 [Coccomyxa elongata]